MKTILIIDDEDDIREILDYNLRKEGFNVLQASNGKEGINMTEKHNPDLIVLDVMMPEMDGIEVCEQIRLLPNTENIRICFLTARSEDYSQIAGFDAGGDDYVKKPIKPKVIISRIKAILRRDDSRSQEKTDNTSSIIIDRERYVVIQNGKDIQLPRKEFELLALLVSKPGNVFERDLILDTVWGTAIVVGNRTIDVHIRKLREKIGDNYIQTVKGIGYKFNDL
ncbi:response regulator transcription factor [Crocinitomicaceae bacterium]|nr:response regulator transcription factor [Crocinitomicaceae bacterium]|tara:strand:+ start:5738 stop:6409 length:672 start_codon:yes stop_codon:yes gene_type:complete